MSAWALVIIYTTDVVSKSSGLTVQRGRGSEPLITLIALMGCDGVLVGWWLFGWQGRFETCPYVWRIASMEKVGWWGGVVFGW